jgi:heat shock protein HslJ
MNAFRVAGIAILVFIVAGCSGSTSPVSPTVTSLVTGPVAPTADQISGTWILLAIAPAGETEQIAPTGAVYTVTFADGRLSTRADCNTCSGAFSLSGGTLATGPALACTRAACPTMAFENEYTRLLAGDSTVTLEAGTLVLSSTRGTLRFARTRQ